ncbi:MAG TPA: PKD domain-containing protein [Nitrososphaeraceae archaeon]
MLTDYTYSQGAGSSEYGSNLQGSISYTTPFFLPGPSSTSSNSSTQGFKSDTGQLKDVVPIADAGQDQIINEGETVLLNGSGSIDPDGILLSYSWKQTPLNPSITLNGADTAVWSFTAPGVSSDTIFPFQLEVTDNKGLSSTDGTNIVIKDIPSNAISESPINNADTLSYDSSISPLPAHTPSPTSTPINNRPLVAEEGQSHAIAAQTPVANAGPDQKVTEEEDVTLAGSSSGGTSSTIDGGFRYSWIQTDGESVDLEHSDTANASFEAPSIEEVDGTAILTFMLTVEDFNGKLDTDTVNVTVTEAEQSNDDGGDSDDDEQNSNE